MTVVAFLRAPAAATLVLVLVFACEPSAPKALVKSAKFGVFFGGQIEDRRELPFELDPGKQLQGFRVEFNDALRAATNVEYRIDFPKNGGARRKAKRAAPEAVEPRAAETGTETARVGETSFEHVTHFHPGDPLGLWNVRVVVSGMVVIDRPVEIFDPVERARLTPPDAGP